MVRTTATVLLALSFLFLNSCHSDGDFMLLLRTDFYKDEQEDFAIIISDKSGRTITYKEFKAREPLVELYGLTSGTMIVTLVLKGHAISIQGVRVGSEFMVLPPSVSSQRSVVGKASYTLQNFVGITSPAEALSISPVGVIDVFPNPVYDGSTYTLTDLKLKKAPMDVLVTGYRDDLPVYQWYRNVQPGDAITANFDSFTPMKTIKVNKRVDAGDVQGWVSEDLRDGSYSLSSTYRQRFSNSSTHDFTRLGYLEGFPNYSTSVSLRTSQPSSDGHYEDINYRKHGSLPSSISLPDFNLTVTDRTSKNFKFQSNKYLYVHVNFSSSASQMNFAWSVTAPSNETIVVPEIPPNITEKYQLPSLYNLTLYYMLLEDISGYDYSEFVSSYFGGKFHDKYEQLEYVYFR